MKTPIPVKPADFADAARLLLRRSYSDPRLRITQDVFQMALADVLINNYDGPERDADDISDMAVKTTYHDTVQAQIAAAVATLGTILYIEFEREDDDWY